MRLYTEDMDDYKPWSGARETYEEIERAGKLDEMWAYLEEIFDDEASFTAINDYLWFESDDILVALGLQSDGSDYVEGETEQEFDDAEEFCNSFVSCTVCPYNDSCRSFDECKVRFNSLKEG